MTSGKQSPRGVENCGDCLGKSIYRKVLGELPRKQAPRPLWLHQIIEPQPRATKRGLSRDFFQYFFTLMLHD